MALACASARVWARALVCKCVRAGGRAGVQCGRVCTTWGHTHPLALVRARATCAGACTARARRGFGLLVGGWDGSQDAGAVPVQMWPPG